ncbi:MAG: SPOR domain-containing protein [Gammaproteobacteria bacterium]|nr:SPOR domain-containing protein [Gammaproteobacteria bacterium]
MPDLGRFLGEGATQDGILATVQVVDEPGALSRGARGGTPRKRRAFEAASFNVLTDQTRYRLTGLVFLIAVAAIFIPMLFDGDGVEPMQLDPMQPADFEVERDVAPPPDMTPVAAVRPALNSVVDADGYAPDTGTRFGDAVLLEDSADIDADLKWAVQVASFSQQENAERLIEQLQGDGYAAFASHVKQNGEPATRVAVGPVIERDSAVRLKTELDRRYEFGARVVRFSP